MYKCNRCGEYIQEPRVKEWDIDDHYTKVNLCTECGSDDITEVPREESEVIERREKRSRSIAYYEQYPEKKPKDFEIKTRLAESEDREIEAEMRYEGEWV